MTDPATPGFWLMTISLATGEAWQAADAAPGQMARTENFLAYHSAPVDEIEGPDGPSFVKRDVPPMALRITAPEFLPDAFMTDGMTLYFSARMREVAALPPEAVQYFDVDTSGSLPAVEAKDYKLVHFPAVRDGVDSATAKRQTIDRFEPDANGFIQRIPDQAGPYTRFDFRADFAPDVAAFYLPDLSTGEPFVTDAFATRVLAAGITDLEFRHPAYVQTGRAEALQMQTKTLD